MKHRITPRHLLIILFWAALWQTTSVFIQNDIIFAGPADVVRSFFLLIPTADFWLSIGHSFAKISIGFCAAFFSGILIGCLAFRFPSLEEVLEPMILLIKSIPVASFVILALIWVGSANLSIFISFLVVFPILYVNTITGLQNADSKLLEMAAVFSVSRSNRIRFIYLPALLPYLVSGCKVALGMSWKSGIAAEVIGVPASTIGENLYMSKIYLATADLFAWTIVIILVSALFEKLFLTLIRISAVQLSKRVPEHRPIPSGFRSFQLSIQDLSKSYSGTAVWKNLNVTFSPEKTYCLMGASGSGKTTLFRILLGLEHADSGSFILETTNSASISKLSETPHLVAVFQENRLCEDLSPLENVMLAAGKAYSRSQIYQELCRLLPEEAVTRPVSTLSGGMKRRAAIVRALLAPSVGILMDEPFTGLDEETKKQVIIFIKEKSVGKLLIISTHQEEDIAFLDGELVRLF